MTLRLSPRDLRILRAWNASAPTDPSEAQDSPSVHTEGDSKYRNVQTVVEGITFASKRESRDYQDLRLLEAAGQVRNLRLQVRYPLVVNDVRVGTYVADAVYEELHDTTWAEVVQDSKGIRTPVFSMKCKLMRALYGVVIREV